mgnify:CR=1 FL=1
MAVKKKEDIRYKQLIITAAVTAVASAAGIALVNYLLPGKGGLGVTRLVFSELPITRQAQLAEMGTVVNVNNRFWLEKELTAVENNPDWYKRASHKDIANIAFVALHSKHGDLKNKCMAILNNLKKQVA